MPHLHIILPFPFQMLLFVKH